MTRPPLARFLDDSVTPFDERVDGHSAVSETVANLESVLADIVSRQGVETVAEQTNLAPELLESIGDESEARTSKSGVKTGKSDDTLTLESAAAILGMASPYPATEIRARIRDHLILQMSREPIDAESLAAAYGFGEAVTVREKIDGECPLSLREYARLRLAVDR